MTDRHPSARPRTAALFAAALIGALLAGCASPQRMAYDALGNLDRSRCEREPWAVPADCAGRPSYDDYERARREELGSAKDRREGR